MVKKSKKKAPRRKLTSERPLKNRPHDPEPPEKDGDQEPGEKGAGEETLPGAEGHKPKRMPRQRRLPGTEDPEIEELENAAEEYADFRDQRMELTKEEVRTQAELLNLMKKYNKTTYFHDGYDLKRVAEKEKVRVRIKKDKD